MVSHLTPEIHLLVPTNLASVTGRPQNFISRVDLLSSLYLNNILRGMTVKVDFLFNVISRLALETHHTKSIVIRACRREQTYISISVLYLSTLDCDTNVVHHLVVLNFKEFVLYTYYLFYGDALEKNSLMHGVFSRLNDRALWGDDLYSQFTIHISLYCFHCSLRTRLRCRIAN